MQKIWDLHPNEFYSGYVRWVLVDQNGYINVSFNSLSGAGTSVQRVCYAPGVPASTNDIDLANFAAIPASAPARQEILATLTAAKLSRRPVLVRVLQNAAPCALWGVSLAGN